MIKCDTGKVIKGVRKGRQVYILKLNIIDSSVDGKGRYGKKLIPTELEATKKNLHEAQALLADTIRSFNNDFQSLPVTEFIDYWHSVKKKEVDEVTVSSYYYKLSVAKKFFQDKNLRLSEMTAEHVQQFYDYLMCAPFKCGNEIKNGYTYESRKGIKSVFTNCIRDAVKWGYISTDPTYRVKMPSGDRKPKNNLYAISGDVIKGLIEDLKSHEKLGKLFIVAILYGLRRQEVLGLRWSSIHKDGYIYIEHTVTRSSDGKVLERDRTKTLSSYRRYEVSEELSDLLSEIRSEQEKNREIFGDTYANSDYIFTWGDGTRYSPDYVTKQFKQLVRKRLPDELHGIHLHNLRHLCSSYLIGNNIDPTNVQRYLGHASVETTMEIYAMQMDEGNRKAAECMNSLVFGD